jgi:hypothetical protein
MSPEYVCQKHGPYTSADGLCPYCTRGSRPPAPMPLGANNDDMPTDLGGHANWGAPLGGGRGMPDDDQPTVIPGRPGSAQNWSPEDAEETHAPRDRHFRDELDVTELGEDLEVVGLLGILWVKTGRGRGKTYKINDGTVVGRKEGDPVNLVIDDPKISHPHAKFAIRNNQFVVADMLSKNGTLVNGARIEAVTLLNENDLIQMGSTTFVLKTML